MSHADSLIPLHADVTVLTGDNDVGKSAVTEAFRAICYNDATDAVIRHDADTANVVVTLGDGQQVRWTRNRKGAPKTMYALLDAQGQVIRETSAPKEVPEWAARLLGVGLLNAGGAQSLDVQVGDQKSPVFLLDRTPSQRAAILDMGRESQYLRQLRDQWKKQVDMDRRAIREGEKRLAVLQSALQVMVDLDDLEQECGLYLAVDQRTRAREQFGRDQVAKVERFERLQSTLSTLKRVPGRVELPDRTLGVQWVSRQQSFQSGEDIHGRVSVWRRWAGAAMPDAVALPAEQTQRLVTHAEQYGAGIREQRKVQIWAVWNSPRAPALPVMGAATASVAMFRSAVSVRRSLQVLNGLFGFPVVEMSTVQAQTTHLMNGYRMGSELQHMQADLRETEATLLAEITLQNNMERERQTAFAAWGYCPFCGSVPEGEHQHTQKENAA